MSYLSKNYILENEKDQYASVVVFAKKYYGEMIRESNKVSKIFCDYIVKSSKSNSTINVSSKYIPFNIKNSYRDKSYLLPAWKLIPGSEIILNDTFTFKSEMVEDYLEKMKTLIFNEFLKVISKTNTRWKVFKENDPLILKHAKKHLDEMGIRPYNGMYILYVVYPNDDLFKNRVKIPFIVSGMDLFRLGKGKSRHYEYNDDLQIFLSISSMPTFFKVLGIVMFGAAFLGGLSAYKDLKKLGKI